VSKCRYPTYEQACLKQFDLSETCRVCAVWDERDQFLRMFRVGTYLEWCKRCSATLTALHHSDNDSVVFQKWRCSLSYCPSKGIAVDKQAKNDVVHLRRFGEADRLTNQALHACP
jgi:hypothetical protein